MATQAAAQPLHHALTPTALWVLALSLSWVPNGPGFDVCTLHGAEQTSTEGQGISFPKDPGKSWPHWPELNKVPSAEAVAVARGGTSELAQHKI